MYGLPVSVTINDTIYTIRNQGDYRIVLDCFTALNDAELSETERQIACFLIFYENVTFDDFMTLDQDVTEQLFNEMFNFFNCGEPEGVGANTSRKLIDWDKDSQMICAAVNKVAGTEIRALEYLHWWTFMGYYCSVGESVMSTVVSIRDKILKGKKLEKYEQEFRRNNPNYFNWDRRTMKEKEDDELLKQLWDFGGDING